MNAPAARALALIPCALEELVDAVADRVVERISERAPKAEPAPLLSTPKLAERLGISRAQVHKLAVEGDLPFRWVGDVRKFDFAACIAALDARPAPEKKRSGPGRGKKKVAK